MGHRRLLGAGTISGGTPHLPRRPCRFTIVRRGFPCDGKVVRDEVDYERQDRNRGKPARTCTIAAAGFSFYRRAAGSGFGREPCSTRVCRMVIPRLNLKCSMFHGSFDIRDGRQSFLLPITNATELHGLVARML